MPKSHNNKPTMNITGRPYARIDQVETNTILEADADFTCISDGATVLVSTDNIGLFVLCRNGKHYLSGQIKDDIYIGLHLIGAP